MMRSYRNRMKYVKARVFVTSQLERREDGSTIFPEHERLGEQRRKIGVCFSGGGTRSATCTHGQIRALDDLGLVDRIGYFSCVSGGSWAALPYTYLNEHTADQNFLGPVLEPEELGPENLKAVSRRNFLYTVTHARIFEDFLEHFRKFAGDETFSRAVGDIFLEQFDLNDRRKFFAFDSGHLKDVLGRNEDLDESDFYTVREGRPYLIVSGALLRRDSGNVLFEMTPWYTGVGKLYEKVGAKRKVDIGGGYVESFAVDSDSPDMVESDGIVTVRLGKARHRFSLSDVIGTSGAAPSEVLNSFGVDFAGFPEFKHWPLSDIGNTKAKEYEIGDGGSVENLGIIPLLKRGVSKIVVFVNTRKKLTGTQINRAVKALFTDGDVNHVFDSSCLGQLSEQLRECCNDGKAAICQSGYTVLPNQHHGITGGQDVEVLWVYNSLYGKWRCRLPGEVKNMIGRDELEHFPHFNTFWENRPKIIELEPIQANLLSHMSCSVVRENREVFEKFL